MGQLQSAYALASERCWTSGDSWSRFPLCQCAVLLPSPGLAYRHFGTSPFNCPTFPNLHFSCFPHVLCLFPLNLCPCYSLPLPLSMAFFLSPFRLFAIFVVRFFGLFQLLRLLGANGEGIAFPGTIWLNSRKVRTNLRIPLFSYHHPPTCGLPATNLTAARPKCFLLSSWLYLSLRKFLHVLIFISWYSWSTLNLENVL